MECSEDITELFNELMTLEMQLVEQLEVRPGRAQMQKPGGTAAEASQLPPLQAPLLEMPSVTQHVPLEHSPSSSVLCLPFLFIFWQY